MNKMTKNNLNGRQNDKSSKHKRSKWQNVTYKV